MLISRQFRPILPPETRPQRDWHTLGLERNLLPLGMPSTAATIGPSSTVGLLPTSLPLEEETVGGVSSPRTAAGMAGDG